MTSERHAHAEVARKSSAGSFDAVVEDAQFAWREKHIATRDQGSQNGKTRCWILPWKCRQHGFWRGIQRGTPNDLEAYLRSEKVQPHVGIHNLKSSWVLCANVYFAHRQNPALLARFLASRVDSLITDVEELQLEWAAEAPLDPHTLLGERKGRRGSGQTSPDVAFVVRLRGGGRGLVLTEVKFTEHSFYPCTGRKSKYGNPDRSRCMDALAVFADPNSSCYLTQWANERRENRRYWEYITVSEVGRREFRRCPASTAGYQLFRQQALAEAVAKEGKYEFVVSCVAYDNRNHALVRSMRGAGVTDFAAQWDSLFDGKARFVAFTHQEWIDWVEDNDHEGQWADWLQWVDERYGLGASGR